MKSPCAFTAFGAIGAVSLLVFALFLSSCAGPTPPPAPTGTPVPTSTSTYTPTATSVPTSTPTATDVPTATHTPTLTSTPTPAPLLFSIEDYQWEIQAERIKKGDSHSVQVFFIPLSDEMFPFGWNHPMPRIPLEEVYLTDSEGHEYYLKKDPVLGGYNFSIVFGDMDDLSSAATVFIAFEEIPADSNDFQLHLPGYPAIDLPVSEP